MTTDELEALFARPESAPSMYRHTKASVAIRTFAEAGRAADKLRRGCPPEDLTPEEAFWLSTPLGAAWANRGGDALGADVSPIPLSPDEQRALRRLNMLRMAEDIRRRLGPFPPNGVGGDDTAP